MDYFLIDGQLVSNPRQGTVSVFVCDNVSVYSDKLSLKKGLKTFHFSFVMMTEYQ
jgi:hypothetical protein